MIVKRLYKKLRESAARRLSPVRSQADDLYNKYRDFTMIPQEKYADNLLLANQFRDVRGCLVECGVWRGGMIAGLSEMLPGRRVYLFDSFEGLPPAKEIDGIDAVAWQADKNSSTYYDNCRAEIQFAEMAVRKAGADAKIIKGWFNETLAKSDVTSIAVLRIDSDWYESTMECLVNFFPKVVTGGLIIIDDYYVWDGCSRAVHDYLSQHSLISRVRCTAKSVAYISKQD
ncbi:MAG: TylF/MycF/NovP-related O-methyltransferase [Cyclobacteriaceae bacterium]